MNNKRQNENKGFTVFNPTTSLLKEQTSDQTGPYVIVDEEVSLPEVAGEVQSITKEIAGAFDVVNISAVERDEMVVELVSNGLVRNEVGLHLVRPIGINPNPDEKIDFLTSMKNSLEFDKALGIDPTRYKNKLEAIKTLEKLRHARN